MRVTNTFDPIFDDRSEVLILGSLPSVKSREVNFYYGHPQNRFWKVVSTLVGWELPTSVEDKKKMLLENRIAIFDVIHSCEIDGAKDSSIRDVVPADVAGVLEGSNIKRIYANGNKAWELYNKYCLPKTGRNACRLPSTSPANAAYSMERLLESWAAIL